MKFKKPCKLESCNCNWLVPVTRIDEDKKGLYIGDKFIHPDPNHAYVLPTGEVYILDHEGKYLIQINEKEKYDLPVATDKDLGGIKVGNTLTIDEEGVLNTKPFSVNERFRLISMVYNLDTKYARMAFSVSEDVDYIVKTDYRSFSSPSTGQWDEIENEITTDEENPKIIYVDVDLTILFGRSDLYRKFYLRFTVETKDGETVFLKQPILTYNKTVEDYLTPTIGTVLANTQLSFDPNSVYQGTKWVRYAKGKTLVGIDEDNANFSESGKTGGSERVTLTSAQMPKHKHDQYVTAERANGEGVRVDYTKDGSSTPFTQGVKTGEAGGDQPHENMPPYITVYYWERVE